MNVLRGRVRGGRVAIDAHLPEGTEVVVLAPTGEPPFDLDEQSLAELETRIQEADRGDLVPAGVVLDELRSGR